MLLLWGESFPVGKGWDHSIRIEVADQCKLIERLLNFQVWKFEIIPNSVKNSYLKHCEHFYEREKLPMPAFVQLHFIDKHQISWAAPFSEPNLFDQGTERNCATVCRVSGGKWFWSGRSANNARAFRCLIGRHLRAVRRREVISLHRAAECANKHLSRWSLPCLLI